jgi:tellurite methyltransferase
MREEIRFKGVLTVQAGHSIPARVGAVNAGVETRLRASPAGLHPRLRPPAGRAMNGAMKSLDLQAAQACEEVFAVLDTRAPEAFARGHLAGSGHIPRAELHARRSELPPRDAAILVVAEDERSAAAAAATIEAMGYSAVSWLDAPPGALRRDLTGCLAGGLSNRAPAERLWRPAPFLNRVLALIRGSQGPAPGSNALATGQPLALDLACGAGRDAVYLAQHGFAVEGWDHAPEALERTRELAERHGVTVRTALRDLERPDLPPPVQRFDLIVCFRFLHRPLFPWMEHALAPGGWLVYETFRVGQERFGKPIRAQFLLARNELAGAFPTLETIHYEEPEPEAGPITARLLARKPDHTRIRPKT